MKRLLLAIAMICASYNAHAVTVINLDDEAHRVVFEETRGGKVSKTVKPGEVLRRNVVNGKLYIHGSKQKVFTRPHDKLVIWNGGKLQIQMRRQSHADAF